MVIDPLPPDQLNMHYEAIVASSDDAILSKDLNGIIRSWNQAAEKIFGYTADETVGNPVTMLIPPGFSDEEPRILARIRQGEKIDHYETVRQRKDGSLVSISLTVSPIKNAAGEVIGASKIARDITDKKQAEKFQMHFGAIVESSDDAIISKDLDGTVRSWNAAAERIFGYKASEIIGRSITILIPEGHQNEEPHIIGRIRKGERVDHYETVRQRKDGSLVNISLTVSPIKDASGTIIGASKIARDVTQQKRVEREIKAAREELASLNEELEQRVQERTLSLNQVVAQMEEFSYSVSHDLRSPIRAMQGYAKALEEDYGAILDDTGQSYIQKIIRSGTRMDKLIVDVLVYSRLARTQTVLEDVSLESILHDIIQHYPEMQPSKADLVIHYPLPHVIGHEPSLVQALSNLLTNAVKFVPEGVKPQIHIFSEKRGKNLRLWIKDNGIGIASEYQTRLFGMFERATQDPRFEGTGIGLAIVRKAIEKMGGTFGLESSEAGGSSFWVELPSST